MSIGQTLSGILVLTTCICVVAQTAETKPPDAGSSGAYANQPPATPCSTGASTGIPAEILTDTMGVDFRPYMTQIVKTVRQNWYNLMPPSVYPPVLKQGKVSIEFTVLKDGKIDGMKLHTSSGDVALDRAAWGSIVASAPFIVLPAEFPGQRIGLRFFYFYNLSPGNGISISVSPCGDVQVPAGSTLQFSASGKGIGDTSVTWSVSGPGCSKSDCGTISDSGLYTAPQNVPSPPTVIVHATSRTDTFVAAKSKLTVVSANPSH